MTRLESRKSSRGEPAVTIPASRHKITYIATDQLLITSTRGCGQFSCECVKSLVEFDEIGRKDVQQGPAVFLRHSLFQNEAIMDLLGSVCELGVIPSILALTISSVATSTACISCRSRPCNLGARRYVRPLRSVVRLLVQ